jgi:predicted MarR family transcription regulator
MAVLAALVGFCHLVDGFTNGQLVQRVAALLNAPYTTRQATYDLRRLKRKGLIHRIHNAHRYELTTVGRAVAVLFTKSYARVLTPGLAILDPRLPEDIRRRSPLASAWLTFQRALGDFVERSFVAA